MAKYIKTFDAPTGSSRRAKDCVLVPTDAATLLDTAGSQTITGTKTFSAGALVATNAVLTTPTTTISTQTLAGAGTGIADAAAITCASPGVVLATGGNNSVGIILPVASAGMRYIVKNDDAANGIMKVYPQVNSKINSTANSALSMAANTMCEFVAINSTYWVTAKTPA